MNGFAVLGQETSDEPDMIGGADVGEIPEGMVQHDQDFGLLAERVEQSRQLDGARIVRQSRQPREDRSRVARREVVNAKVKESLVERDRPFTRDR